eukprot:TRINITY_DN1365_c0_g1_i2.p1 TRINITY_DN1365_c0_g1~~TRINITY_DN1365_c0_g1_i2.p1  ORF type:complete len:381 (-),score=18.64 TRINITY_DN1365_c0_g1_i2:620-1762(-)
MPWKKDVARPRLWTRAKWWLAISCFLIVGLLYTFYPQWQSSTELAQADFPVLSIQDREHEQSFSKWKELTDHASSLQLQQMSHVAYNDSRPLPFELGRRQREDSAFQQQQQVHRNVNAFLDDTITVASFEMPKQPGSQRKLLVKAGFFERTVLLYELYNSEKTFKYIHNQQPYRPMSLRPNVLRLGSTDINVPESFPILHDVRYQQLLCEYAAIFFLDPRLQEFQGRVPWLGFQSWRAHEKGYALTRQAFKVLVRDIRERELAFQVNAFYFWSTMGVKNLYENCEFWHKGCKTTLALVFQLLFGQTGGDGDNEGGSRPHEGGSGPDEGGNPKEEEEKGTDGGEVPATHHEAFFDGFTTPDLVSQSSGTTVPLSQLHDVLC